MEESHPVPQDITSFEFHLVGDMTLKQFTYLASGLAVSYLVFVFLSKPFPIISWPIIVLSALIGTCYAFLPIAERPLDHWTMAFFRAIFSPTKRTFKSKYLSQEDPAFNNRVEKYLHNLNTTPIPKPVIPTPPPRVTAPAPQPVNPPPAPVQPTVQTQLNPLSAPAPKETPPPLPVPVATLPTPNELKKAVSLAKGAQDIQSKIVEDEKKLEAIKEKAAEPGADPTKFTHQFDSVLSDLKGLNNEASEISKQLAELSKVDNSAAVQTPTKAPLKIVPSLSLTSIPNIINGIITDAQGNYLENTIIVAHDRQGIPVRALKSNKLGQFITATPLPDGRYVLTTEKESLYFPSYEIELKGEVLPPIVISAQKATI